MEERGWRIAIPVSASYIITRPVDPSDYTGVTICVASYGVDHCSARPCIGFKLRARVTDTGLDGSGEDRRGAVSPHPRAGEEVAADGRRRLDRAGHLERSGRLRRGPPRLPLCERRA